MGAPAGVDVQAAPAALGVARVAALGGRHQVLGLAQQPEGGGTPPVGYGPGYPGVDALAHDDVEPSVVATVPCGGGDRNDRDLSRSNHYW